MPQRSKIDQLPSEVRDWLNTALTEGNHSGFVALSEELKTRGFEIGKSAIGEYSQKVQRRISAKKAATEAALLMAQASPDEADALSAAVIGMAQTGLFDALVDMQEVADAEPADRVKILSKVGKTVAELSRASVNLKKFQTEVANRTRAAADSAERIAKRGGLSEEAVDEIRNAILGIST